jgi:DNA-binding XRE family transcriptional regulator
MDGWIGRRRNANWNRARRRGSERQEAVRLLQRVVLFFYLPVALSWVFHAPTSGSEGGFSRSWSTMKIKNGSDLRDRRRNQDEADPLQSQPRWHLLPVWASELTSWFDFGQRVRALRQDQGFSQERFAAKCGIDRTYMGGIELARGITRSATLNASLKLWEFPCQSLCRILNEQIRQHR